MKNHEEERRQLKKITLLNFLIIATIILCGSLIIGEQTHQLKLAGQFAAFLLIAGLACIPIINRRAQQRLELLRNSE